jgi:translation elongation factor EF-Ts
MKPLTIGELPTQQTTSPTEQPKIEENETRLLYQEFIMKANTRVVDFLNENKAVVNDFVRLECGETLENESTN